MLDTTTYSQTQTSTRHSHSGLWLALGISAVLALFSLLLVASIWLGFNKIKDTGPTPARFYLALHDQNYALAYTYLDNSARVNNQTLDQSAFISLAAQSDADQGAISGFELTTKDETANATVKVSRPTGSYQVHLQLKQTAAGKWLITSLERL